MPTIGVIAGDGVGPEVVARGPGGPRRRRPAATGSRYELVPFDLGGERYLKTGEVLPDAVARRPPPVRRHLPRRRRPPRRRPRASWRRGSCSGSGSTFHQYVNLRPVRLYPGRRDPDQGQGARRHRHGRRPREQRGPLRRRRRVHPQGDARGGRDPDLDQHPGGRRALPPVRLRPGAVARARRGRSAGLGAADRGAGLRRPGDDGRQDQRPDLRPRPLDAGLHRGLARLPRRSRPTISTSTPAACGWSSAPSGST